MIRGPFFIGSRVTWSSLPGKPTVFAPAPHTHPWSDITGKPASFPPSAHTHLWADITDKPGTFPPAAHTHPWSDVTGKPATYPPASHTHLWADITDRPTIPAATPLGAANPRPLGTVSAGTSGNAAREDHVHPTPSGLVQLIGTVTVSETATLSLALGMKRMALTLTGVAVGDRLTFAPTGLATTGCEAVNAYASGANQVTVSYFTPALGIGSAYSIPLAVYRIT